MQHVRSSQIVVKVKFKQQFVLLHFMLFLHPAPCIRDLQNLYNSKKTGNNGLDKVKLEARCPFPVIRHKYIDRLSI